MGEALRILYVEDDPALGALLARQLERHAGVASVVTVECAQQALAHGSAVDVALLDLALGTGQPNGFELGILLRGSAPELPIVMFSQYPAARIDEVLPPTERHHWSYVRKHATLDIDELVDVMRSTVLGVAQFDAAGARAARPGADVLARLTPRQREVMAFAALGLDARAIAERLHLAHVSVRRELSRSYRVLVPDAEPGTDLRTAAVLEYLRLTDAVGTGSG